MTDEANRYIQTVLNSRVVLRRDDNHVARPSCCFQVLQFAPAKLTTVLHVTRFS